MCALLVALLVAFGLFRRAPNAAGEALPVADFAPAVLLENSSSRPLENAGEDARQALVPPGAAPQPQSGPLQLRGRVLDSSGRPLADASVVIAEFDADKPGVVRTVSAADGSFEARGEWKTTELVVRATHADCWNAAHRRATRGLEGLELRLERFATLSGVLATPDGQALPDVVLTLINKDTITSSGTSLDFESQPSSIVRHTASNVECTRGGSFTIRSLRPGPYELLVTGVGGVGQLAHVPEISLGAGERWFGAVCDPLLLEVRKRRP